MFMTNFGSPLLTLGRSATIPAPQGAVVKVMVRRQVIRVVFILFLLTLIASAAMTVWFYPSIAAGSLTAAQTARNIGFGAGIAGFSLVLLTAYHRHFAPWAAPLYSLLGGVFMAGLALGFEARFPGIAVQSIFITLAIFLSMLCLYASGLVKVTRRLTFFVYSATAAIAFIYLGSFLLLLLDLNIPFIHGAGTGGILWFGFIVTIAAMNLLMDFDRIERLEGRRQPDFMPWFVALGLMVTLVWLYVSVLRLMARVRR